MKVFAGFLISLLSNEIVKMIGFDALKHTFCKKIIETLESENFQLNYVSK